MKNVLKIVLFTISVFISTITQAQWENHYLGIQFYGSVSPISLKGALNPVKNMFIEGSLQYLYTDPGFLGNRYSLEGFRTHFEIIGALGYPNGVILGPGVEIMEDEGYIPRYGLVTNRYYRKYHLSGV